WRTVDAIKVGSSGYALLIDEQAKLLADGDPASKARIARGDSAVEDERQLAIKARNPAAPDRSTVFDGPNGVELLAVAAPVGTPDWTVLVEQPTSDAFSTARWLERQLLAAIGLATLGTIVLGWGWARSFIRRIFALTKVTRDLAGGNMEARVTLTGRDEIRQLGDAF